jgi:hypothetical protein
MHFAIIYIDMTFGKGKKLKASSKYLRDPQERTKRILDVAERNSIIEGLPKFSKQTRQNFARKLRKI